jgi:ASC-1-like (ASCH) protein
LKTEKYYFEEINGGQKKTENLLRFEFCRHLDLDFGDAIVIEDNILAIKNWTE